MADADDFGARLDGMVAQLRADDRVEVYTYTVRPPASAADLAAAAKAVMAPIPAQLEAFYRAHDGVFPEWGLAGHDYERTEPFSQPDYGQPPGCINLSRCRD